MPRPRKGDPTSAAPTKIEAAFWELLEEVGYAEITVRRVSQTSGTNRNSFYYHYDGLEDLARKAFLDNASGAHPFISSLIAGFQDNGAQLGRPDDETIGHARRVMLCARSESPFLRRLVSELLRDAWFDELGIDTVLLSEIDRVQIEFIFAGLIAVLGCAQTAESPLVVAKLASTRLGKASIAALREIADRQSGDV